MKTHIYTISASILILVFLFSCSQETSDNFSANPFHEYEWLNNIKLNLEVSAKQSGAQIIQYTYNQNTVFWIDGCYNCFDNLISIYNDEGEVICEIGGIAGLNTCPDFLDKATDSIMLWNYVNP